MVKTVILTDSTAHLSEKKIIDLGVRVVPLYINFKGDSEREGTKYSNKEFFRLVAESPILPTTSQPSAGDFVEAFSALFNEGAQEILGIFISSELSGTLKSAQAAVEILGEQRIHLFDSGFTSSAQRFMVEEAVDMSTKGCGAAEIITRLQEIKGRMHLYFVVNTLDNLRKGGRIGGAASLIGNLLQLKPILYLNEGKIELYDKVRTKSKAWARVCELLEAALSGGEAHRIGVLHAASDVEAENLSDELRVKYPTQKIEIDEVGQVVGTHVGQGTIGICFYSM